MSSSHKKIVYVSNTRLPTEKAHGLALMKLCAAFQGQGREVVVIAPRLWRKSGGSPFTVYGLPEGIFSIRTVFTIDLVLFPFFKKIMFWLQMLSFSLAASFFVRQKYRKDSTAVIFSHDYIPLFFLSFLPLILFYDIHHFPGNNFMYRRVMKKAAGFGVQTRWKIGELERKFAIPKEKIVYWPNGTDVADFSIVLDKKEARKKLGVPPQEKVALYTGQLFSWKGVRTFLEAARYLKGVSLYIVGGNSEDLPQAKEYARTLSDPDSVHFVGPRPHEEIPLWLKAADVLVLPNTGMQKVSLYYTSPMKLFEYMASGRPIVASDIPSIREVLMEEEAFFAEADNPKSFAEAIKKSLENLTLSEEKGKKAALSAQKFSWGARAEKLGTHIDSL